MLAQINFKKILVITVVIFFAVFALYGFKKWGYDNPVVKISSDSSPVTLQIDTKKLTVGESGKNIRLKRSSYNYLASFNGIALYGNVDTVESANPTIRLNYKIFSKEGVRTSLCAIEDVALQKCEYTADRITVKLLADNSWALVKYMPKDRGVPNYIALHMENGAWSKVADSDDYGNNFSGLVPSFVSEEVR